MSERLKKPVGRRYFIGGSDARLMATVITINRPGVVALIRKAAKTLTHGNKIEAVALAVRRLLEQDARAGSLFGAHRDSVRVQEGVDPQRFSMLNPMPKPAARSSGD